MPISLSGSLNLSGSLTTTGTITATTLVVQTITSSISSITGSTNFGSLSSNTHTFTGSLNVTGSAATFTGNIGLGTISPNIGGYSANSRLLTIQGVNGSYGILELTSNSANADGSAIGRLDFGSDGQAANYKAISSIASFLSGSTSTKFGADLRFYTRVNNAGTGDPVERMRITSAGNIGIGVTPAAWANPTVGKVIQIGNRASFFSYNNTTTDSANNIYFNGADYIYLDTEGATLYRQGAGLHQWFTAPSGTLGTSVALVERMRIQHLSGGGYLKAANDGSTYVSLSSPYYEFTNTANSNSVIINNANTSLNTDGILRVDSARNTTNNSYYAITYYHGGSGLYKFRVSDGGVISATSATITVISSDRNLKTDIRDYNKGLAEVLAMKPRIYKRKDNLEVDEVGFIAQEMDEALPGSMIDSYHSKDNNEPVKSYQLEWYPLLVKAIQELTARVQYLENK